MKSLFAVTVAAAISIGSVCAYDAYSMDAAITLNKETKEYQVFAKVLKVGDGKKKDSEEIVARPRIVSARGVPASFYVGPAATDRAYRKSENISMEVSWPEDSTATCTITVKRGDKLLARSKTQLNLQDK
jgi:hypothetical protein